MHTFPDEALQVTVSLLLLLSSCLAVESDSRVSISACSAMTTLSKWGGMLIQMVIQKESEGNQQ